MRKLINYYSSVNILVLSMFISKLRVLTVHIRTRPMVTKNKFKISSWTWVSHSCNPRSLWGRKRPQKKNFSRILASKTVAQTLLAFFGCCLLVVCLIFFALCQVLFFCLSNFEMRLFLAARYCLLPHSGKFLNLADFLMSCEIFAYQVEWFWDNVLWSQGFFCPLVRLLQTLKSPVFWVR